MRAKRTISNIIKVLIVISIIIGLYTYIPKLKTDIAYTNLVKQYTIISGNTDKYIVFSNETKDVYKASLQSNNMYSFEYSIEPWIASNKLPYKYDIENNIIRFVDEEK
ncbi:MAG: hypothetical protein J6A59_15630 [Lachnospiraceae bacterium]|nr:hypothetical protein [Lachnospiraceae bacterium]